MHQGEYHTPQKFFTTFKAADNWLLAEQLLIDNLTWTPPKERESRIHKKLKGKEITLKTYANEWVKNHTTQDGKPIAVQTKRIYRSMLKCQLAPLIGKTLAEITTADIETFWQENSGHKPIRRKAYALLAAIMRDAENQQLIDKSPCRIGNASRTHLTTSRQERNLIVSAVTPEELAQMIDSFYNKNYQLALQLCAYSCLRIGEALALTPADFKPYKQQTWQISITKAIADGANKTRIVQPPKTQDSTRAVLAPPHLDADIKAAIKGKPINQPLFSNGNEYLKTEEISGPWKTVRRKYGHPKFRVYDLRHWGRMIWTRAGLDYANMEMMMGHRLPIVAGTYAHLDIERIWPVSLKVSELAGWKVPGVNLENVTIDQLLGAIKRMTDSK